MDCFNIMQVLKTTEMGSEGGAACKKVKVLTYLRQGCVYEARDRLKHGSS